MNVLYVGNRLSVHGGALTGIEILGPLLENRGYSLRYASSKKNKALRLAHMLSAVFRYRNWADRVLIDTYSTSNFWYAAAVGKLCRWLGLAYIPILHGGNLPSRLKTSGSHCQSLFGRSLINVAPSGYLEKAFADAGFRVKMFPNPISLEKFAFKSREHASPNLLWVRGIGPMSNPRMAILATAEIRKTHRGATLTMVGPDKFDMTGGLRELARELEVDVRFTGRLSQEQWAALSTECDIFINTSTVDNAPFSLVEAMALGLFVVTTDVGGIPYVADNGNDALMVPDGDHLSMARAVEEIIGNEQLRHRLQQGAREKSLRFSAQEVMPQWDEILRAAP